MCTTTTNATAKGAEKARKETLGIFGDPMGNCLNDGGKMGAGKRFFEHNGKGKT